MSNKDEFDVDLDENADEGFDEVSLDEETAAAEAQPAKKKSGGGLVSVIAILAVLGGGTFAAVKFFGVQLPFNIPGLTPTEQVAQQTAAPAQSEMTATADLPQDSLPPQPEIPADDSFAAAGEGLPGETAGDVDATTAEVGPTSVLPDLGISAETSQDADISPPWGETAPATTENAPADAPATVVGNNNAADSNIVDPFAVGTQDVTADVNNAGHAAGMATQAAPAGNAEVVDPFAVGATPAETAATPDTSVPATAETTSVTATTSAPAADAAQTARTSELEKKVADLEKSLADAEKALKKANDDLASTQKQLSEKTDALAKTKTDTKAATTKAADAQPAAVTETAAKAEKDEAKPAAKKAATAPARKAWVLRSAKPGIAWVSEKGSNEMRTVSVGDTLSGIGKVTAITTDAQGRWVVNGTRGTINQ